MSEEGYWVDLPQYFPGCPAVVVPFSRLAEAQQLEQNPASRRFIIRAIISDHIPLAGTLPEVLQRPNYHRLTIDENPQPIYLEQGGYYVFYDLCRDDEGRLSGIQVEVEADHPFKAFPPARTVISQQL